MRGAPRAFSGRVVCHFCSRFIGKVGFKIAGKGMMYIHGTENFLMFLFGKREKFEIIAYHRDKNFWRDLIKQKYDSSQEIDIQHPPGRPYYILVQFS